MHIGNGDHTFRRTLGTGRNAELNSPLVFGLQRCQHLLCRRQSLTRPPQGPLCFIGAKLRIKARLPRRQTLLTDHHSQVAQRARIHASGLFALAQPTQKRHPRIGSLALQPDHQDISLALAQ